ncbi:unnamed protein product [Prorocentrum cordatum]|uniref:Post-GPI attachment to proteins factor 3 n=1 Tax=Prorocentrum cordatum TaxID=2364126 RepID=A0ABN9QTR4_9DINO|nr:unnamed protein product [Polarella glacialis]
MPAGAVRFRDPAGAAGEKREAFGQAAQPRLPYRRISSGELDRARRRKEQKQEQSDEREEKEVATPCSGTTRSTMTPMTTLEDSEKEEEEEKEVSAALSEQKTKKRAPLKRSSSQHLGNMDDSALPDFDIYPEYLRIGPWSPVAYVYLACIFAWLLWSSTEAVSQYSAIRLPEISWKARALSGALGCYTVYVHWTAVKAVGWWPYVSYTMCSYSLLSVRFILVALGGGAVAEFIRFPTLAMNSTTTVVWWALIAPAMMLFMPQGNARRKFLEWNFSFFLVNVHLLNLPLALIDHHLTWRPLGLWDIWAGIITAMMYLVFYLNVLDKRGMHFYIILSPRRAWCCVPGYTAVLLVYFLNYWLLG